MTRQTFPIILPKNVFTNLVAMGAINQDLLAELTVTEFESTKGNGGVFVTINKQIDMKPETEYSRVTMFGNSFYQLVDAGLMDKEEAKQKGIVIEKFKSNSENPTTMVSVRAQSSSDWDAILDEIINEQIEVELTDENELAI